MSDVSKMVGMTFDAVSHDDQSVSFWVNETLAVCMYHQQDCCESVWLEDVDGELSHLQDTPILEAEEVCTTHEDPGFAAPESACAYVESATWTFYRFRTAKGYVTLRWFGQSNGYYSESVDVEFCGEVRGE